jgi:3-carboxy-cis,cis-muconate cycloisomerase
MFSPLDSLLTAPLLATPEMRAVFSDRSRLRAMLQTEAALAAAEAQFGLAPGGLAAAIRAIAPEDLDAAAIGQATALSGVPTIPFVKAVQQRLPAALEKAFHKGATTQDILDTALVLQCRDGLRLLRDDLTATMAALTAMAEAHRATPCAGRTYGQHAAPVTFGFKVAIWLSGIVDVAARLPAARDALLVASLGGPVGTLAALKVQGPAVLEAFAAELGLGAAPMTWHTTRARIAQAGAWLAMLIGALAKLATDVAHLASTEVSEAAEPYVPGRGGSSAMPHKRNPVSCTVILAAHAAAPGLVATLLTAMAAAHERPPGLWYAEWHVLPQLFGLASGALHEARRLAEGLEVDTQRMRRNLDATNGLLFADAAAGALTPSLGREAAHHAVEQAAGEVRTSGQQLSAVLSALYPGVDLSPAFDLTPAIEAASPWIDRAVAHATDVQTLLQD